MQTQPIEGRSKDAFENMQAADVAADLTVNDSADVKTDPATDPDAASSRPWIKLNDRVVEQKIKRVQKAIVTDQSPRGPPIEPPDASLNTSQAANNLGVSYSWLTKLRVYSGGPIYSKLGRRVTYSRIHLDMFRDAHCRTSTADTGRMA